MPELTEDHWKVINYLRDYYKQYGIAPMIRKLCKDTGFPLKTIYELFQLIGTGKYLASALGVWAMVFLAATILGASLILGKKMGAIFRV